MSFTVTTLGQWESKFKKMHILCTFYKVLSSRNRCKPIKSCYDFCASWMKKKFLHSYVRCIVKKPNKGMQHILLRHRYKQPIFSLKRLLHIFSYSLSCYCYSHRCSDFAATVTVSNLFRASSF